MGFSVVADEVRNLAHRCTQAAKDTSDLIDGSVVKSKDGSAKAAQLIADYETGLAKLTAGLTPERLATAVQIAAIPQKIRGFGHVKEASVGPAKAEEQTLWGRWEKAVAPLAERTPEPA